jgi:hypothetical protein
MIIDIHSHIFDEKVYADYLKKAESKISKTFVIYYHSKDFNKIDELTKCKKNLFLIGCVNTNKEIGEQLIELEKLFKENKIIGIKLYPGYEPFYPSDKKIWSIAELCSKYNKPLIFHSGDVWSPDNTAILKYSRPIYVDELAVKFPMCKIIISHFGFPYLLETANIVSKNPNVFTDVSGLILQPSSPKDLKEIMKCYTEDIKKVLTYFPIHNKIMFGTDYSGEDTPLNQIKPYIRLVKKIFPKKKDQENIFWKTAERVYFE